MAIGFILLDGLTVAVPDKMLQQNSSPKIFKASFGDGYEQRIALGINNLAEEYSVSFNNRTKDEIDDIMAFFDYMKGVSSFLFTIPDSNAAGGEKAIRVVCENYSKTLNYCNYYSCSAKFRRVYEP